MCNVFTPGVLAVEFLKGELPDELCLLCVTLPRRNWLEEGSDIAFITHGSPTNYYWVDSTYLDLLIQMQGDLLIADQLVKWTVWLHIVDKFRWYFFKDNSFPILPYRGRTILNSSPFCSAATHGKRYECDKTVITVACVSHRLESHESFKATPMKIGKKSTTPYSWQGNVLEYYLNKELPRIEIQIFRRTHFHYNILPLIFRCIDRPTST